MTPKHEHHGSLFDYNDAWDSKWDDMKKYGPSSRHIRRIIKGVIRPLDFRSVLDVGCGEGSFLAELLTGDPAILPHGIDISAAAVELAALNVPSGHFWVLDIQEEHLEESFDLVICSEVLEHIPDDQSALQNLARMTKKYLVLSTLQGRMRRFESHQVGHLRNYSRGDLVQKTERSGFRVLKTLEWGFPFYSPLYRDFLELIDARGTTGDFGLVRKTISLSLYHLFGLNSSRRGDMIFLLLERRDGKRT